MKSKKDCYFMLQKVVCARDVFCRRCNQRRTSAGHHIFGRSNNATCFDPKYSIGLCLNCHENAHAEPEQFDEWAMNWMGEKEFYDAVLLSNSVVKHQDLDKIYEDLSAELTAKHW